MKEKWQLSALVGKDTELQGKLKCDGTLMVEGRFKGDITTNGTLIVEKGAKVKILVKSTDVKHGIAIEGYNIRVELPVNEEKTFELIADQTGSFTYYCSVPCGAGHRSMKGTLIVE